VRVQALHPNETEKKLNEKLKTQDFLKVLLRYIFLIGIHF
jgi:hypothetical protein